MSDTNIVYVSNVTPWFWPITILTLSVFALVLSSLALADSNNSSEAAVQNLTVLGDVVANRIGRGIARTNRITQQTIPTTTEIEVGNVNMVEDTCTTEQYLNYATNRVIVTGSGWKFIKRTDLEFSGSFSSLVEIKSVKPITLITEKLFLKGIEYDPNSGAGEKGDKGQQGDIGMKGIMGLQGPTGSDGKTGDLGPAGEDSKDKGEPGTDGQDGPAGQNGLQGLQGNPGNKGEPGFLFNDPTIFLTQAALLASSGTTVGDFAMVVTSPPADPNDGELYSWNGTGWDLIATVAAPGAKGAKGEKGTTTNGESGETGDVGPKGEAGPRGPQGEMGEKGEKGAKGEEGAKGDKGNKGNEGTTGPDGPKGDEWVWTPSNASSALKSTISNAALSVPTLGVRVLQFDVTNSFYRGMVKVGYRFGCPEANLPAVCDCPSTPQYTRWVELKEEAYRVFIPSSVEDVVNPTKVYFELEDGIGGTLSQCVSINLTSTLQQTSLQQIEGSSLPLVDLVVYVDGCTVGQTRTDSSGNWTFVSPEPLTQGQVITVIQNGLENPETQVGVTSTMAIN